MCYEEKYFDRIGVTALAYRLPDGAHRRGQDPFQNPLFFRHRHTPVIQYPTEHKHPGYKYTCY